MRILETSDFFLNVVETFGNLFIDFVDQDLRSYFSSLDNYIDRVLLFLWFSRINYTTGTSGSSILYLRTCYMIWSILVTTYSQRLMEL